MKVIDIDNPTEMLVAYLRNAAVYRKRKNWMELRTKAADEIERLTEQAAIDKDFILQYQQQVKSLTTDRRDLLILIREAVEDDVGGPHYFGENLWQRLVAVSDISMSVVDIEPPFGHTQDDLCNSKPTQTAVADEQASK